MMHFLLIDEDDTRMKIVTARVKNETTQNAKCTWAKNSAHALEILQYLQPDMVLLHQDQPGIIALTQATEAKQIKLLRYMDQDSLYLQNADIKKAI
jgi:response regulator of citrate/malate metabolism